MSSVQIGKLAGDHTLGGAANGVNLLAKLLPLVAAQNSGSAFFLDFADVAMATSSFLRESVLGLRNHCRLNRPDLQVVVANPNQVVLEELNFLLGKTHDALIVCRLNKTGTASDVRVVGVLDAKQALALKGVLHLGSADAASLAKHFENDDDIGLTGWSNRLAALATKGLLVETKSGRSKIYRPTVEGMSYGT
jgi:hypothetical protein